MSGKGKTGDKELDKLQDKIETSQKTAPKPEHPCPYCEQEMPIEVRERLAEVGKTGDISLNLKDANEYGDLKAEEDYEMNKLELVREDLNSFLQETAAEKYDYYNPNPGLDWDKGVITGTDANNELVLTEKKVDRKDIMKCKKLFYALQKQATKTRRTVTKRKLLLNEFARKYKWISFPCDIRNNKFVDITSEVLKQQDVRLQQIEQQLRTPRIKDETRSCAT